jgi:hypothetical protein
LLLLLLLLMLLLSLLCLWLSVAVCRCLRQRLLLLLPLYYCGSNLLLCLTWLACAMQTTTPYYRQRLCASSCQGNKLHAP